MNPNKHIISLFLLGVLIAGCQKEAVYHSASARRTVLVYLGVDNNLRGEASQKITQLKKTWNKNMD